MGSTSTLAALVRALILSAWSNCTNRLDLLDVDVDLDITHRDLNPVIGEDEGGVGGSEFDVGLQNR